jgi:hypothetical protein
MTTLSSIVSSIQDILQDAAYTNQNIVDRINEAVNSIAAGIRMPDGQISPPLPDLYAYGTVSTSITLPYVSLPTDYQRSVKLVYDSSNYKINPPTGGNYYSFALFMRIISKMDLSETGSIYAVAVKGTKIYYQGIPTTSTTIGVHYYRKPTDMALDGDTPDGIPEHLQLRLIKHFVCKEIMGEMLEAGVTEPAVGMKYHEAKFYTAMIDLCDFIGIDATPQYYGSGNDYEDGGACDG